MYAGLEVAVAGQHRTGDQIAVEDLFLDGLGQRAGVANAGGAAVADHIEADLFQIAEQSGGLEVFGNGARTGAERGLDLRRWPDA